MLTHTYILQDILEKAGIRHFDSDIFVYNIIPDLLTIHPAIKSQQTHSINRIQTIPPAYAKAAYIMFHLLIDDLAHYGMTCPDISDDFNPDSQGYSYLKGKPLIGSILDFHKGLNKEISYAEAAYRSHLIVEMIYDIAIIDRINTSQSIELLAEAIHCAAKDKKDEFVSIINWLYGIEERAIREVLEKSCSYITTEKMKKIMNIEGRIRLYAFKFDLQYDEQLFFKGMKNIFLQARELLDDNEIFLKDSLIAVKRHGWLPPVT